MVSTRSASGIKSKEAEDSTTQKRSAPSTAKASPAKKAKKGNGKLEVNDDGEVTLAGTEDTKNDNGAEENLEKGKGEGVGDAEMMNEKGEDETKGFTDAKAEKEGNEGDKMIEDMVEGEGEQKGGNGVKEEEEKKDVAQNKEEGNGVGEKEGEAPKAAKARETTPPSGGNEEPQHGTLESGHIYFLYRPKIDATDVEGVDDISKFHILLIPKSGKHASGHYHRIIEVGKKKLPDPGSKRQIIWGLVGSTGTDQSALKPAFGEYSYETKTKGTRTQQAARPAARGHYILHSPQDEVADSPDNNRQRDYKVLLAYEITTPAHEDFGRVQEELGVEEKGAVVLSIKDPDSGDNAQANPRAADMPREKKAHYPKHLHDLFGGRRWIAPNPVSFLDYQGSELLIMSSAHGLEEMLGKDGDKVEGDLDKAAEKERTDIEGALKELGMGKGDVEIEALEGAWA